jgi:hypothetical protein
LTGVGPDLTDRKCPKIVQPRCIAAPDLRDTLTRVNGEQTALANALVRLTGRRVRKLPLLPQLFK